MLIDIQGSSNFSLLKILRFTFKRKNCSIWNIAYRMFEGKNTMQLLAISNNFQK